MEFEHNEVKTPDGLSDHLPHSCMSFCASVDLEVIHFNYSVECRPLCRSVKMAYGKKKGDQVIYSGRKWSNGNR